MMTDADQAPPRTVPDVALDVPVRMPAKLAGLLADQCRKRGRDLDSAVCEAVETWCREG